MKSKRTFTMHGRLFLLFQYSVRCAMYRIGLLHCNQPWMDSRISFVSDPNLFVRGEVDQPVAARYVEQI